MSQSLHEREPKTVLAIVKELDREHVARLDVGVIKLVGALIQKARPGAGAQWVRRGLTGLGARVGVPARSGVLVRGFAARRGGARGLKSRRRRGGRRGFESRRRRGGRRGLESRR